MTINSTNTLIGTRLKKTPNIIQQQQGVMKLFGLGFPFVDKDTGGYLRKLSGLALLKANIRQLLQTRKGERVMLPDYGTNLKLYLMEPLDQVLFTQIKKEILNSMLKYIQGVYVTKIDIIPGNGRTFSGGHHLQINLYCVANMQEQVNFEVGVSVQ